MLYLSIHHVVDSMYDNSTSSSESLYIIGGLAASEQADSESDGTRTRNDVCYLPAGSSWERVLPPSGSEMPWGW